MRNLNLDQLRALIEVVELGSFTEAAKRLHLTQPAISQQIRELENRCGLELVERIGKRPVRGDGIKSRRAPLSHGLPHPSAMPASTSGIDCGVPTSNHMPLCERP